MGKPNRGQVTKLSIRLTEKARSEIKTFAENLNLSQAQVVMFSLHNILKNRSISKTSLLNMQHKYDLTPTNFAMTIKKERAQELAEVTKLLDMNKNIWVGLLVSEYFETRREGQLQNKQTDTLPYQIKVELNVELKKKLIDFSEKYYISLSGLIAYALLKGPSEDLPIYETNEKDAIFTNVPTYVHKKVQHEADLMHITDFFYMELCLYNAFMGENKYFEL